MNLTIKEPAPESSLLRFRDLREGRMYRRRTNATGTNWQVVYVGTAKRSLFGVYPHLEYWGNPLGSFGDIRCFEEIPKGFEITLRQD